MTNATASERAVPHSLDAERALLGSIILDNTALPAARKSVSAHDFYSFGHRLTFNEMCALHEAGRVIDIVTLSEAIQKKGLLEKAGGAAYLASLTDGVPRRSSLEHYVHIIRDRAKSRQVINAANQAIAEGVDGTYSGDELADRLAQNLVSMESQVDETETTIAEDVMDTLYEMELEASSTRELLGCTLSIPDLDASICGLRKHELMVIGALPERGKCLAKGTLILMFSGSLKAVEDVIIGDLLMGPDSKPRAVLALGHGTDEMFDVIPTKGETYRVNSDHILALRSSDTGKHLEITVRDWLLHPHKASLERYKGYRTAVSFPTQEVTVDPYYLGLWLGDGAGNISNPDIEIKEFLETYAESLGCGFHSCISNGKCPENSISNGRGGRHEDRSELLKMMENLGFHHGDKEGTKIIPRQYLINSREIRLQLLAGLLDTDGWLHSDNIFEISQKDHLLAMQIVFLCRSLGLAAYWKRRSVHCQTGPAGESTRVTISGELDCIPTRVKRKQAKKRMSCKNVLNIGLTIHSAGVGDYFGFTLDGDGLFVLGDFTVTHNTAFALQVMRANGKRGDRVDFFSLEMGKSELMRRMMSSMSGVHPTKLRDPRYRNAEDKLLIEEAGARIAKLPIQIHKPKGLTPAKLVGSMRRMVEKFKKEMGAWREQYPDGEERNHLLIVDHLKAFSFSCPGGDERHRMNFAIETLRRFCDEEDVAMIVLHHFSRPEGGDINKMPTMIRFKESGDVEAAANIALGLHRPEDPDGTFTTYDNILVMKMRAGEKGPIAATFNKRSLEYEPDSRPRS